MIWFTADTHFYHGHIIDYCNRPARSIDEMNEKLIRNWNDVVKPEDEIYHLGDFAFCGRTRFIPIINQLNGRKYWVRGNHDRDLAKKEEVKGFFEWIKPLTKIRIKRMFDVEGAPRPYDQKIVLCHFPILSWEGMAGGTWMLHGHCHGSLKPDKNKRMDVGVDCHPEFRPFSFLEVEEFMASRSFEQVDHHKEHSV